MSMNGWVLRDDDGLLLEPHETLRARRPGFAVEAAGERSLRISVAGRSVLWARIDDWWEDLAVLQADGRKSLSVVPPISMADGRRVALDQGHPSWWSAWERWFAHSLIESERSPLYPSPWRLGRPAHDERREPPEIRSAGSALVDVQCRFECGALEKEGIGGLCALRQSSAPQSGRVSMWRKRARDGVCPPILALYVQVLGKHVVLDGHDRLQACVLEGIEPPCLVLWPERRVPTRYTEIATRSISAAAERMLGQHESPPKALVTRINTWVSAAFNPWTAEARTRAFSIKGGLVAWKAEVHQRLEELGDEVDAAAVELLLDDTR